MATIPATIHQKLPQPAGLAVRPTSQAGSAISIGDIVRILKQRLFMILFVWFFLIGLTVVLTYLQIKYLPVFKASALIKVEPGLSLQPEENLQSSSFVRADIIERLLLDEASAIRAVPVLQNALLDVEVQGTKWYQDVEEYLRVQELEEDLRVSPVEGTSMVRVSIATHAMNDPHRIVNAVVRAYLSLKDQQSRTDFRNKMKDYQNEEELHRKTLADKQREIANFRGTTMATPGAVSGINILGESLSRTASLLAQLTAQELELKALYETYENSTEIAISPQVRMMVENDPAIANLNFKIQALKEELAVASDRYGSSHRQSLQLQKRIEVSGAELARKRSERLEEVEDFQREQARVAYLQMVDQKLSLQEEYENQKAQQRDLDQHMAEYEKLQAELKIIEEKYNQVREHVGNLQFLLRQRDTIEVSLAQSAQAPIERSSPLWIINIPMGTFLGIVVAIGLALMLELVDTNIRAPMDITRHLNLPLLGTIPDVDDEETVIDTPETAVVEAPRSCIAEAFRTVRTNLFFSAPPERQRTVLLTSPKPEDGKTMIAVNLGATMAFAGKRVLLVDANFRRPALHSVFKGANEAGLSNVLVGREDWAELVCKTSLPNLDYLPTGPAPPNPSELLGGDHLRRFMDLVCQQYDKVLFDSAPILLANDAIVLSTMVDGIIMIYRAKENTRGVGSRARDLLQHVNAHVLGAILNAAQVRRGGYFREQLRTFYDYQAEALEAEKPTRALPKGEKKSRKADKKKQKKIANDGTEGEPAGDSKPADDPGSTPTDSSEPQ